MQLLIRLSLMNNTLLGTILLILVINLAISIVALVFQLKFYKAAAEEFGAYF